MNSSYSGKEYTYTLTARKPGGEGYVFAYIKDRPLSGQTAGYERFINKIASCQKKNSMSCISIFSEPIEETSDDIFLKTAES